MKEIGSEFWLRYPTAPADRADSGVNLLSGRTALRFIIDDLRKRRNVRRVLLPSYCCESMILPFLQAGMKVDFYPVYRDLVGFPADADADADAVLLLDFFGYTTPQTAEIARLAKRQGMTVIYDATHKLDGNPAAEAWADYSFCSFRKWFYCNYAKAVRHDGDFALTPPLPRYEAYEGLRDEAAREKEAYMVGETNDKESYLRKFRAAEEMLDGTSEIYGGAPAVFEPRGMIEKRRENAAYLMRQLKGIPGITLWREELKDTDTPLFLPILVDPSLRGDLRSALIREQIYCPIHWPKSPYHGDCGELYDRELSLICDQRYDLTDMARMVGVIQGYFNR